MSFNMKNIIRIAIFTMIYAGGSSGVIADHTVVDNLQCSRDAEVITTTWTVADPTESYGGDLKVKANFIAYCSNDSKKGNVDLEIHLSRDKAEIYSYWCDEGTADGSECTGTAAVKDVEAALSNAVAVAAKALCEEVGQSLVKTENEEIGTDVKVQHLQKGEKVRVDCNKPQLHETSERQPLSDSQADGHSH